jgi:glycosyltransferase involved in cell wall biosynthesis
VVVPSERLLAIATERWRLPRARIELIPNGIQLERFRARDGNPELRARLGIPSGAFVAGWVGHLRPEKNPARFLEACRADPRVHALVLGEGAERAKLEELARGAELAGRVHLVGHQSDPAPWYRAMDLFVISSDTEQMPVALLEAMASSLPVVATDVGDIARMLPPAQAPHISPLEARALTQRISLLADRPDERAPLGSANRARVEQRYTFATMLAAYRRVYELALAR